MCRSIDNLRARKQHWHSCKMYFSIKSSITLLKILNSITFLVDGTSDPNDCPSCQHDDAHEVPGEPLSPLDFKNAEKIPSQSTSQNSTFDPMEQSGLFEGDIIIHKEDPKTNTGKNAIVESTQKWAGGVVPYMISSQFDEHDRSVIARAIMEYHQQTCISFKPRSNENDYVMFSTGGGCSSPVGRIGGPQHVTLGEGCVHPGIVMHELMHALGFWHEQSRWDRDDHVLINYENILTGMEDNFRKMSWKEVQNLSTPYDTGSIMHYGPFAFSRNRQRQYRTILSKIPNEKMGQRLNFSEIDVYKINKLYKCFKKPDNNESSSGAGSTTTTPLPEPTDPGNRCSDNHKDCPKWASSGECQKNPNWMLVNCKHSCNQCRTSCSNNNKHCEAWASSGECSKNPEYMTVHCAKACKKCKS